ncbi:helix-turn-helix domain-containing protein [Streptomyces sp. NPDC058534]|uniref:helix-turn-helix domain-containing protein n=1 Tax=Streptomyces sp. NPDC058534 TaxID=3346541 RepID=UPI00365404E0
MYRLNIARLREIAAKHGDKTAWAIAKRSGVSVSSAYRYIDGSAQPDLNSALRLAQAYDLDIRTVMDAVEDEDEPAGAVA